MTQAQQVSNLNWANAFTMLRVAMTPAFAWLMLREPPLIAAAIVLYALASLSDTLDGWVARRLGLVTSLGEFLDPTADKLLVLSALAVLAADARLPWAAVAVIAAREVAVEGLRVVLARRGRSLPAAALGKAKKVSQDVLVFCAIPFARPTAFTWVVLAVAVVLTIASAAEYFADAARGRAGVPWR